MGKLLFTGGITDGTGAQVIKLQVELFQSKITVIISTCNLVDNNNNDNNDNNM